MQKDRAKYKNVFCTVFSFSENADIMRNEENEA